MTDSWVPGDACTLPTAARPLRVAEFDTLFAAALRSVERRGPDVLRLELDATAAEEVRDLVARESACCAFFEFELTSAGEHLRLDVRVPAARTEVLDGLAGQALRASPP